MLASCETPKHLYRIPCIKGVDRDTHTHLHNMLQAAIWIILNNDTGDNKLAKELAVTFITSTLACDYLNTMYYNNHLNISFYLHTFDNNINNNTWSFYSLHFIMNIYDYMLLSYMGLSRLLIYNIFSLI